MAHRSTSTAMVDRGTEMATLDSALSRAEEGEPSLVAISGEVGIGKSRLLTAFADRMTVRVLSGSCFPVAGESMPFAPVIQAFRELGRALDQDERARLEWCWPYELAFLGPTGRAALESPGTAGTSMSGQARLFESILSTLGELAAIVPGRPAPPPVLLALEDLHWADRSTLDLISFLVRNLRDERVLVVLTMRTDEPFRDDFVRDWYAELVRLSEVTTVTLGRLTHDQTAEHLGLLHGQPLPARHVEQVYRRTDGNPLFTEEALPWVLHREEMPASLTGLINARLSALPDDTRRALGVVAVLSGESATEVVAAVAGRSGGSLEDDLRPALDRRVLQVGADGGLSFSHPLVAEIVETGLLPGDRKRLHADAARALSARAPTGDDLGREGRIAHHWHMAGATRLAFESSIRAGVAAETLFAFAEADEHFTRALDLLGELDPALDPFEGTGLDRVDLLVHAAQAAHLLGDGGRAANLADRAAQECADSTRRAAVLERKGQICVNAGLSVEAEAAYDEALDLLSRSERSETLVRAMSGRANLLVAWSRFDEAETAAHEALELARAWDFPREEGRALGAQGLVLAYRGRPDEGADQLLRALELAYALADPDDLGTSVINTGHVLGLAGRYDEAVEVCAAGYDALRRVGLARQDGAFVRANAVECLIRAGRWDDASGLMTKALDQLPRGLRGFPVLLLSARLALVRGDLDEARRRAAELDALADEHGFPEAWLREMREVTAGVAWWDGRPEDALAIAERGLADVARSGEQAFASRLAALAARALGDLAEREGKVPDGVPRLAGLLADLDPDPLDASAGLLPDSRAWSQTLVAELGRARRVADPKAWGRAVSAWEEANDAFFHLYARWRYAEALVMRKVAGEATVAAVRDTHTAARELGALLVVAELEKLARWARVDLASEPEPGEQDSDQAVELTYRLTEREREVLAGLVAGRTNRQLADAMFISVKTASVHVSNVLRKLHVNSREQAARIGARLDL